MRADSHSPPGRRNYLPQTSTGRGYVPVEPHSYISSLQPQHYNLVTQPPARFNMAGHVPQISELDWFDLIHRPQARSVPLQDDETLPPPEASNYAVLTNIPADEFSYSPREPSSRFHLSQISNARARYTPLIPVNNVGTTATPRAPTTVPLVPLLNGLNHSVANSTRVANSTPAVSNQKYPHLAEVLATDEVTPPKAKVIESTAPPVDQQQKPISYPFSKAISSLTQLLGPEENNNVQKPWRRECARCTSFFTPIPDLNGSQQLLCNSCGVQGCVSPGRVSDSRATPSPSSGHSSPSPGSRDKKKQVYPLRTDNQCANCGTTNTSLWRRSHGGDTVCNACGLYYKLHGVSRPQSMRKDGVQIRRRKGSKMVSVGD